MAKINKKEEGASTTVCQILSRSSVELKAAARPQYGRGGGQNRRNIGISFDIDKGGWNRECTVVVYGTHCLFRDD